MAAEAISSSLDEKLPPIFNVNHVQLQFELSADLVAAQVANDVLILALATGRIMRIDLEHPSDIDDLDLPKRPNEIGLIRKMFLDPTASHLIISTTTGENFYLHSQSRQPKQLHKLKSVVIDSVGWNPALPTASTREILIGASDGNVYEVVIETATEFYRREERYVRNVHKVKGPVSGLSISHSQGDPDRRNILVGTPTEALYFSGQSAPRGEGAYTSVFSTEPLVATSASHSPKNAKNGSIATTPKSLEGASRDSRGFFACLFDNEAILMSNPVKDTSNPNWYRRVRLPDALDSSSKKNAVSSASNGMSGLVLSEWHIITLVAGRLVAFNRLNERSVFDEKILPPETKIVGLHMDYEKNTYWIITPREIYEISLDVEERDIWKIYLQSSNFEAAIKYARTTEQKNVIASSSGDALFDRGDYHEAAKIYGNSSKGFEEVALSFMDKDQPDALRVFLRTKLATFPKAAFTQRQLIALWLVDLYMAKLNSIDDAIATQVELSEAATVGDAKDDLSQMRAEFKSFVVDFRDELDQKSTYDIIGKHGREEELLTFATAVDDSQFILSYWIQRERWQGGLAVLQTRTDPDLVYRYSSVFMQHLPGEFVEVLMRNTHLNPRRLVPALLNYTENADGPLNKNQAVRYLQFCINHLNSTDSAIHNTLISIFAAHPDKDESQLLQYFSTQSKAAEPLYNTDFALRLCIQHHRVKSCVHLYTLMGKYESAVGLALKHDEIELAANIADKPAEENTALRKSLWLSVAKKVITSQTAGSIKTTISFLKRCELLKIEDLLPFFPDFVLIDDFKEEICTALESYSRHIDSMRAEMDASERTSSAINSDIRNLSARFALVMPGESCRLCGLPMLMRQFFVFPSCQHGFHSDCLGRKVVEGAGISIKSRIRELQGSIGRGVAGKRRDREVRELDSLIGKECMLCNDYAIKLIEEPFLADGDDVGEWVL